MLTTRDLMVIDFLKQYKVATTSTIQQLFYPSQRVCQNRLKAMIESKKIKRMRNYLNKEYIYYISMPKQFKHSLYVTEFYRDFSRKYKIEMFRLEMQLDDIRPDAFIAYSDHGKAQIAFLEVEISNKGFNYNKYEKFYSTESYKKWFPFMPTVFIVGNLPKLNEKCRVKYIYYPLKLKI